MTFSSNNSFHALLEAPLRNHWTVTVFPLVRGSLKSHVRGSFSSGKFTHFVVISKTGAAAARNEMTHARRHIITELNPSRMLMLVRKPGPSFGWQTASLALAGCCRTCFDFHSV